ncbi:Ig-like domain-containing protein [Myxococcaceae bacterium GXIMD 01537]
MALALGLGPACIKLPDIDPENPDSGTPQPDAGDQPDASTPDASTPETNLTVTLQAPGETVLARDEVDVQVRVTGGGADAVELRIDGQRVATLEAPYTHRLSTKGLEEGRHELTAKASLGDKAFTSEPREVQVDRTPPTIVTRRPAPGANDVWVREPIEVTFSEPVKASTLSTNAVELSVGGAPVTTDRALSSGGVKLTIAPRTPLRAPGTANLTLASEITDLAGNPLAMPAEAWAWGMPESFPLGILNALPGQTAATDPALAIGNRGSLFTMWRETSDPQTAQQNVYVAKWTGTEWEQVGGTLNDAPITNPTRYESVLRTDPSGNPVAAWLENPSSDTGNIVIKSWTGTEWLKLGESLNANGPSAPLSAPQSMALEINPQGKPVIVWEQYNRETSYSYIHIRLWTGLTWTEVSPPIKRNWRSEGGARPALIFDRTNAPVVAWTDMSSNHEWYVDVRRWNGITWEPLDTNVGPAAPADAQFGGPSLTLDSTGNILIAWAEIPPTEPDVRVRRWTGQEWEYLAPALNAYPGETPPSNALLKSSSNGHISIMWAEPPTSGSAMRWHMRRWTGAEWLTSAVPYSTQNVLVTQASFALDGLGVPYVGWTQASDGGPTSILVRRNNE